MPKGYTTKQKVADLKGGTVSQSDAIVNFYIEAVEKWIDNYTGRDFGAGSSAERRFDGDGTDLLFIPDAFDITAIKLSENSDPLDADYYWLYPSTEPHNKIRLNGRTFPVGVQNIYITAEWGHESVPADVQFVATKMVLDILNGIPSDGDATNAVKSLTIGRYSVSYDTAAKAAGDSLLQAEKEVLEAYRIIAF